MKSYTFVTYKDPNVASIKGIDGATTVKASSFRQALKKAKKVILSPCITLTKVDGEYVVDKIIIKSTNKYNKMADIKFKHWECDFEFGKYSNGRLAIRLMQYDEEIEANVPVAVATVNMPGYNELEDDEVLIKNWSENKGMLECLTSEGWIEDTGKTVMTSHGFTEANVCKITDKLREKIEESV